MTCPSTTVTVVAGASFLVLASIPADYPDGHFAAYTVQSQLRTPKGGLIADLSAAWDDPLTTRVLKLSHPDTSDWPVGTGVFDIVFTDPTGQRLYTSQQAVVVTRGVTQP